MGSTSASTSRDGSSSAHHYSDRGSSNVRSAYDLRSSSSNHHHGACVRYPSDICSAHDVCCTRLLLRVKKLRVPTSYSMLPCTSCRHFGYMVNGCPKVGLAVSSQTEGRCQATVAMAQRSWGVIGLGEFCIGAAARSLVHNVACAVHQSCFCATDILHR